MATTTPEISPAARAAAFEISHDFAATPARLWRAWTEVDELRHWWGPKGFPPCHCDMDLRSGGRFHYGLQMPDGGVMWGRWEIHAVRPERGLDFIVSFSDDNGGGPTRHPFEPEWPLQVWTELRFEPAGATTRVHILWLPVAAADNEIERFGNGHDDCRQGWTGTFEQLARHLGPGESA